MKEQNRNRLELIDARFGRRAALDGEGESAAEGFDEAFARVCSAILRPVMEDVSVELRKLGHAPWMEAEPLEHEGATVAPCLALHLGMRGRARTQTRAPGFIAFGVVRASAPEVLAWLCAKDTPFDLRRYPHPDDITEGHVEQLLVDAIEQIFSRG